MAAETAVIIEFAPAWADIDNLFDDGSKDATPLHQIYDMMVERQGKNGDLKEPCPEAQELLKQWSEDLGQDQLPNWRAAVARRSPGVAPVSDAYEPSGTLNDATIFGEDPGSLEDFLNRPATLLIGEMWGARDRRNTQDGDWNSVTMSWGQWIGGQEGTKTTPTWGFSRHPKGKHKEGASIVLGSSIAGARKAKAMDTMFGMGLDIDSGARMEAVREKIIEKGLLCFIYSSFNNGKRGIELKRDEVLRKMKLTSDPTNAEVRQFLREFDKNRYEETFIAECSIKEQKHQTTEGVKIVLDTPPLEKFRLIFPLVEPVKIIDLDETQQGALDLWEDKVTGLAQNVLGVHFDTSCTDPSRLFYTARHPEGGNWACAIVQGDPLDFRDIPEMRKSTYTSTREVNAFTEAGGGDDDRPAQCYTPSGASLNSWHNSAKDRFMIADLLETLCPDKVRHAGGEAAGHVHTECPFEHEHSSEGGTATMAVNCLDSQNEYWTWFCHHDACQGRHKLQFLEEALRQGWFEEDALSDVDQGFLLEVADGEDDPFEPVEAKKKRARTFEELAGEIDETAPWSVIEDFCKRIYKEGADKTAQANVVGIIANNTNHTRPDVKAVFKELDREARKSAEKGEHPDGMLTTSPAPELTQYAADAVRTANKKDPFLFEYMEEPTIVRRGRIKSLDRPGKRYALGRVTVFQKPKGEGDLQHVYPPYEVVDDLFSSDLSDFCLPLRGAVDTPFFAADGTLVTENGYHAGSQMYLDSNLELAGVSPIPTDEEVQEAKRLLVSNVLADFPLGGLNRPEIMAALDGEAVPAVTHAVGLTLLPFIREMIDGPTPGWILSKPAPGTGASLLVKLLTTIASGVPAPESTLPSNKEEVPKTLAALLQNDPTHIVFDNINHSVDSGDLASAQTARTYQARVLGKTQTIEVDVRSIFIFTANNVTLSNELLRRSIFIPMDAKVEAPEKRTGFLHEDVFKWVDTHRAELVHACLTLIQNWVAQGMQRSAYTLASFEDWAKVTGGVLEAAGFAGFLQGQDDAKALAADAAQNNVTHLMDVMADFPNNTLFRPGGTANFGGEVTASIMSILNGEERAKIEPGDDKPDPIQINSWGYSPYDGCYNTSGRIKTGFSKMARKPHRGRSSDGNDYVLHFEELYDSKNKGAVFRMAKVLASAESAT